MRNKPTDFLKKIFYKYLSWIIALVLSGILALAGAIRLGSTLGMAFYRSDTRSEWIIFIILFTLMFTFILNKLIVIFLVNLDIRRTIKIYTSLIAVFVFIQVLLFLIKGRTTLAWFVSDRITGKRGVIVATSDVIIFFGIIPIFLIEVLNIIGSKYKVWIGQFLWVRLRRQLMKVQAFFTPANSHYYHRFFITVLVALALLPMYKAPSLMNLESDFWGHKWLLDLFASTRLHMGDHVFNVSIKTNENWFVYTGESSLEDYQNTQPFSQSELADIQRKLDRLDNLLKSKGVKLIVVVPPNKNTIYPEYMPLPIPVIGDQSRLDQLVNYEQQHGEFKILDLRQAFMKARSDVQIYYPCDTHWNPYGAFVAYQEIFKALEKDFPKLKVHTLTEFRYVPSTEPCDITDLENLNLPGGHFNLAPVFDRQVTEQDWQKGVIPGSFYVKFPFDKIITTNADSSLPRLVMYRDSFGVTLIPFLADHFSRGVYLWAFPEDESYYDSEKPNVVILEYTERYLFFLLHLPG
jgi:hypothetical protein